MSPAKAPLLEAIEISKSYGARLALDRVSLAVRPGEIAALLGPMPSDEEIAACVMEPDPDDLESALLKELEQSTGARGNTIIAFCLTL